MAATSLMVRMLDVFSTVPPFSRAREGLFVTTEDCGLTRIEWLTGKGGATIRHSGGLRVPAENGMGILGALQRWDRRRSKLRIWVRHFGGASCRFASAPV